MSKKVSTQDKPSDFFIQGKRNKTKEACKTESAVTCKHPSIGNRSLEGREVSEQKQTQGIGISTILSSSMNNEHKELGSQMKEQSVDGEVIGSEIMIMFCLAKS